MWRLLAELARGYCAAASWAEAAGDESSRDALVDRAWLCLLQRGWYAPEPVLELRDVIRAE